MRACIIAVLVTSGCPFVPYIVQERQACDEAVECVVGVVPDAAANLSEQFGSGSPCWDTKESAEICEAECSPVLDACRAGLFSGVGFDSREIIVTAVGLTCFGDDADFQVHYDGWVDNVVVDSRITSGRTGSASVTLPEAALVETCDDATCDAWEYTIPDPNLAASCGDLEVDSNGQYLDVAFRVSGEASNAWQTVECVIFGRGSRAEFGDTCACADEWQSNPPSDPCGN